MAALTDPALGFDVTGKLANRQLDLDAKVGSPALDVAAKGRLDLARSRFVGVEVLAKLLKPQAASPTLSGQDVRAAADAERRLRPPGGRLRHQGGEAGLRRDRG